MKGSWSGDLSRDVCDLGLNAREGHGRVPWGRWHKASKEPVGASCSRPLLFELGQWPVRWLAFLTRSTASVIQWSHTQNPQTQEGDYSAQHRGLPGASGSLSSGGLRGPPALSCWKNLTEGSSFTWELLGSASPPVFSSLGTPASADKQACWWLQGRTLVMWSLVCGQEGEHRCVDPRSADEEPTVRPQAAALMMYLSKRTKPQMVYKLGHRGSAVCGKCPRSSQSWRVGKNAVGLADKPSERRGYGES